MLLLKIFRNDDNNYFKISLKFIDTPWLHPKRYLNNYANKMIDWRCNNFFSSSRRPEHMYDSQWYHQFQTLVVALFASGLFIMSFFLRNAPRAPRWPPFLMNFTWIRWSWNINQTNGNQLYLTNIVNEVSYFPSQTNSIVSIVVENECLCRVSNLSNKISIYLLHFQHNQTTSR